MTSNQRRTARYALVTVAGFLVSLAAPHVFAQDAGGMSPAGDAPMGASKPDAKPSAKARHGGKKGEPKRDAASVHKKKHKKKHKHH